MDERHILYHITSVDCAFQIVDRGGIDPSRSIGKRAVSWYVTKTLVPWAIAHVLNRHGLGLGDVCVLHCAVHPRYRIRTSRGGVWCADIICPAIDITPAAEWLDKAELKIYIPSDRNKRGWRYGYKSL
jgi:hypothetical protein